MTYEMLTGRLPFNEGSQAALLMKQVTEPVPDVREVDPLIPESVALWVTRMTEKDPEDRFPDARRGVGGLRGGAARARRPAVAARRGRSSRPARSRLDDIPPQTDTPLRPPSRSGARRARVDGAATPAFRPTTRPRRCTSSSPPRAGRRRAGRRHAAAARRPRPRAGARRPRRSPWRRPAPSARRRPRRARPTCRRRAGDEERSRAVPIAVGAVVAAIVAFVVGMSSGGGEKPASASGDGFVLKAPAGWAATGAVADPALGAKAVALAPAGATAEDTISAARVPAGQGRRDHPRRGGAATAVDLSAGRGPALRRRAVRRCRPAPTRSSCPAATAPPRAPRARRSPARSS